MKKIAILISTCFLLIAATAYGENPAVIAQWEYKVWVQHGDASSESGRARIEKKLTELGAEGWELVSVVWVTNNPGGSPPGRKVCYFKRLKVPVSGVKRSP